MNVARGWTSTDPANACLDLVRKVLSSGRLQHLVAEHLLVPGEHGGATSRDLIVIVLATSSAALLNHDSSLLRRIRTVLIIATAELFLRGSTENILTLLDAILHGDELGRFLRGQLGGRSSSLTHLVLRVLVDDFLATGTLNLSLWCHFGVLEVTLVFGCWIIDLHRFGPLLLCHVRRPWKLCI